MVTPTKKMRPAERRLYRMPSVSELVLIIFFSFDISFSMPIAPDGHDLYRISTDEHHDTNTITDIDVADFDG